jgi:hypothetical protein
MIVAWMSIASRIAGPLPPYQAAATRAMAIKKARLRLKEKYRRVTRWQIACFFSL